MADSRGTATIIAALIAGAATIIAALIGVGLIGSDGEVPRLPDPPTNGSPSAFLSRDSGPGGTVVRVSGEGFAADERVVLRFHTEQVGSTRTNGEGRFANVAVTIPGSFSRFAPQQFSVVATGRSSIRSASAPFTITG